MYNSSSASPSHPNTKILEVLSSSNMFFVFSLLHKLIKLIIPGVEHSPPTILFSLNFEFASAFTVSEILSSGTDTQ